MRSSATWCCNTTTSTRNKITRSIGSVSIPRPVRLPWVRRAQLFVHHRGRWRFRWQRSNSSGAKGQQRVGQSAARRCRPGHADAYPIDANKNFAIPATNPIPLWNANHPSDQQLSGTHLTYTGGNPTSADYGTPLGEIYATGTRQHVSHEHRSSRPATYGWATSARIPAKKLIFSKRARTMARSRRSISATPRAKEQPPPTAGWRSPIPLVQLRCIWNLSGGGSVNVDSTNPIREGDHSTSQHHRPSARRSQLLHRRLYISRPDHRPARQVFLCRFREQQYFHAGWHRPEHAVVVIQRHEFQSKRYHAIWRRSGTRTTVANSSISSLWNTLVFDPKNPNYTSALGSAFGIGRVVSFGEDNSGNLYIIDFGGTRGDNGFGADYPNAGAGQIFMLVPVPEPASIVLATVPCLFLIRRRRKHRV